MTNEQRPPILRVTSELGCFVQAAVDDHLQQEQDTGTEWRGWTTHAVNTAGPYIFFLDGPGGQFKVTIERR